MNRTTILLLAILSILFWNCNNDGETEEVLPVTPDNYRTVDHLVFSNFESDTIHLNLVRDIASFKSSYYLNHDSLSIEFSIQQEPVYSLSEDTEYEWTIIMSDSVNPFPFPNVGCTTISMVVLQEQHIATHPVYHFFNESILLNEKAFSNVFSVYETVDGIQCELHYSLNKGLVAFKQNNQLWTLDN